jgi:hypothetical protein
LLFGSLEAIGLTAPLDKEKSQVKPAVSGKINVPDPVRLKNFGSSNAYVRGTEDGVMRFGHLRQLSQTVDPVVYNPQFRRWFKFDK